MERIRQDCISDFDIECIAARSGTKGADKDCVSGFCDVECCRKSYGRCARVCISQRWYHETRPDLIRGKPQGFGDFLRELRVWLVEDSVRKIFRALAGLLEEQPARALN